MKTLNSGTSVFNCNNIEESHVLKNGMITRFQYQGHYQEIDNTRKLKALLREGQYMCPGGYTVMACTSDGAVLCNKCIKENLSSVLWSIKNEVPDGWKVEFLSEYYGIEDNGYICCDNCNQDFEEL